MVDELAGCLGAADYHLEHVGGQAGAENLGQGQRGCCRARWTA
jgi:hypothetical protein